MGVKLERSGARGLDLAWKTRGLFSPFFPFFSDGIFHMMASGVRSGGEHAHDIHIPFIFFFSPPVHSLEQSDTLLISISFVFVG